MSAKPLSSSPETPSENAVVTSVPAPEDTPQKQFVQARGRPFIVTDAAGSIQEWNPAAEQMFGWTAAEAIGTSFVERLFSVWERGKVAGILTAVLGGHPPIHHLSDTFTKEGRVRLCEWEYFVLPQESGVCVAACRDITRQRRTEHELERLYSLAAAAVSSVPLDDILLRVRDTALEMGVCERISLWRVVGKSLQGIWGTDKSGQLVDLRGETNDFLHFRSAAQQILQSEEPYTLLRSSRYWVPGRGNTPLERPIDRAVLKLRVDGVLLGVLIADNLWSRRPLVREEVESLLPLCELAAVMMANDRLRRVQEAAQAKQKALLRLSAALTSTHAPEDVLRMVVEAVTQVGGFDRAGIFLYEESGQRLQGTWGIDRDGHLVDIADKSSVVSERSLQRLRALLRGEGDYYRIKDFTRTFRLTPASSMYGVRAHATIALRVGGKVIGILCVDNLRHDQPIEAADIEGILPFAEQAAAALEKSRLLAERERQLERQRRLGGLAAAVNARTPLDDILRMTRDALVEAGGFDRAGVHLYDDEQQLVQGTWGTDREGKRENISSMQRHLHGNEETAAWQVALGKQGYSLVADYTMQFAVTPENPMYGVRAHAAVPMRVQGKVVGILCVDNLLSDQPITEEDVSSLMQFAEQAAVAVYNARLLAERERQLERQRRLGGLAAAINASTALDDILRMVRDAAVEAGGFDRAGVYLYDPEKHLLREAWGTDAQGKACLQEDVTFLLEQGHVPVARLVRGEMDFYLTPNFTQERELSPDDPEYGLRDHALLPFRANGGVVGILSVDNILTNRPITEEDVHALMPFADQAAVAIQKANLFAELRQTQEALIRTENLRAVGELASGVAHNINNVLTAILGYAELIEEDDACPPAIAGYSRTIQRSALDGADIVRRVQQFTRKETHAASEPFDLSSVAQEAVAMARPAWHNQAVARGAKIEIKEELPAVLPVVGIASEIREVLINLLKNAAEAMPQGGTITLQGELRTAAHGQTVELRVHDTGVGMDAETTRRIFEPFFTTKGPALGSGLGLSVAWGIVKRHNGTLDVLSRPGVGTTFVLCLPYAERLPLSLSVPPTDRMLLAGLSVLLVEDEEFVADSLARLLSAYGAAVEIVPNAERALYWLENTPRLCDVLLSDHGMAGMTGLQLLEQVRAYYPTVRRILISGWHDHLPGVSDTSCADILLHKPIRRTELIETLRAVRK